MTRRAYLTRAALLLAAALVFGADSLFSGGAVSGLAFLVFITWWALHVTRGPQ